MSSTDWKGKPIPENEPDDNIIRVWCVSPHKDSSYDYCVLRSWHDVCDYIRDMAESSLDGAGLEGEINPTSDEPFTIKVWLQDMKKCDYDEIVENSEWN